MPSYNLSEILEAGAARHPERCAIVFGDTRLSYADVNKAANQVAHLLASRGIGRGDKVALMLPNLPWFTIVYNGVLKAGATVVPLNVLLKAREVAYHLDDSDAVALFATEGSPELPVGQSARDGHQQATSTRELFLVETLASRLADHPTSFDTMPTDEDDTAVILYTSGTTGKPKGAELRHRNMRDNARLSQAIFRSDSDRPDTYLSVLPLFHSFGQTVVQNGALAFGGTIVMLARFEPHAAFAVMLKEKVTFFAGVPTMYWALLGVDGDTAAVAQHLRIAASGGAALPVEIHREFEKKFGIVIAEGYGLSETSPVTSFKPYGAPARPGSIGVPVPGVELKLLAAEGTEAAGTPGAVGEIAIRGHNVFKGYYRRPGETAAVLSDDGWFRTGDLATREEDGWYRIVDRTKDLIIRGGFNVYPREVEEVLLTHPEISLAAVIGVPDERHGEEVKAVVVLTAGATAAPEDLVAWSKNAMAAYKYPRLVEVVDELPMTATSKILKRDLRQRHSSAPGRN